MNSDCLVYIKCVCVYYIIGTTRETKNTEHKLYNTLELVFLVVQ